MLHKTWRRQANSLPLLSIAYHWYGVRCYHIYEKQNLAGDKEEKSDKAGVCL